jgi:signal transduction histidine kinase
VILIEPVVVEVRESAGLASDASIVWISAVERGLAIDADPDQLFRVLLNLVRNAAQALENRPRSDAPASWQNGMPLILRSSIGIASYFLTLRRAGRERACRLR